jgi:fructose-1,6-bisphosphatase/inositol monophosphatase family enzyme
VDDFLLAQRLAQAAGVVAMRHLGRCEAQDKGEGIGSPVTIADTEAEAQMASILLRERPEDGVVGEEGASRNEGARRQWLLDPIDGTLLFTRLLPGWSSVAALIEGGRGLASAIHDPTTGRTWSALGGLGAMLEEEQSPGGPKRASPLRTSGCESLSDALLHISLHNFHDRDPARSGRARALVGATAEAVAFGAPSSSLCLVAEGKVDAWANFRPKPWDSTPGAFLVEEAGGATAIIDGWHLAAATSVLLEQMAAIVLAG